MGAATWRPAGGFAARTILCVVLVSLWWLVPVLLTTKYAPNFLPFTERPLTILATPSLSESLRLLGYWVVYYGLGGGPATPNVAAGPYLFQPLVIVATFVVPLLAFAGFAWTRRWSYSAYFVLLGAVTVILMSLGFPPGNPANRLLLPPYYQRAQRVGRSFRCFRLGGGNGVSRLRFDLRLIGHRCGRLRLGGAHGPELRR
jgi:hypothetical protein